MTRLGWSFIIVGVIVLLVFGAVRINDMAATWPTDDFGIRYREHPVVALVHMLPGLLYLTLAPLQFVGAIRRRRLWLHRLLGRVLVPAALVSGVFALVAAARLPAYGGAWTEAATYLFGPLFLFSLAKAVWHIRRREVAPHREWMIRAFALALGVASIRLFIFLFSVVGGYRMVDVFPLSFWLGLGGNALVAELWIRHTRPASPAARAAEGTA